MASPELVTAYAIAGDLTFNPEKDTLVGAGECLTATAGGVGGAVRNTLRSKGRGTGGDPERM